MLFNNKIFGGYNYDSRLTYYKLMEDCIKGKITPLEYSTTYLEQRNKDIDHYDSMYKEDQNPYDNLPEEEKKFDQEYTDVLWEKEGDAIPLYEKGIKKYNVSSWKIVSDILEVIDIPSMEYHPSDDPLFDASSCFSEEELFARIKPVYEFLTRHKDRLLYN